MKTVLATVNITPDGRVQANPEMLVMPEEPEYKTWKTTDDERRKNARQIIDHREMVDRWHSGLVDFEDQEGFWFVPSVYEFFNRQQISPINGSTYTVELPEFEVVNQASHKSYQCDLWVDIDGDDFEIEPSVNKYRRVLRFK